MDLVDLISPPKTNFVPCVRWVRRGVAKANPDKVELTEEELQALITQTKTEIDDNEEGDVDESDGPQEERENNDDEFDFAHYDDENENSSVLNVGNILFNANASKDSYVTLEDDDDDSEKEDDEIHPGDNLILIGHVEGDASILEVYVHNEEENTLYVHHDVMLPAFPLCIEWLGVEPLSEGVPGNLCAIGTMSPVIEIWDLDIVDCIEAACKLGKKRNKKKGIKSVGHKDAVLDLSWNTILPHILASGSVDQTVLLWDLDNGLPASKLTSFNEKVQTLKWHPFENQTLLTGCCDGFARVFDCRTDDSFKRWEVEGEVERVLWNHFDPFQFFVGTSSGKMYNFDCRNDTAVWCLDAHCKEVTGLCLSAQCPGLLATASIDGSVKIWDVLGEQGNSPCLVSDKDIGVGKVYCLEGCPDSPFIFCAGGDYSSHNLEVWDLMHDNVAVQQKFSSRQLLQSVSIKPELEAQPSVSEPMDTTGEAAAALESLSLGQGRHRKATNKKSFVKKKNKLQKKV